jgi:hypothetical protein
MARRHAWRSSGLTFDRGSKRRLRRLKWRPLTPWSVWVLAAAVLLAATVGARLITEWHESLHRVTSHNHGPR